MSAQDGAALFSAFPLGSGASVRVGVAKGGDGYAWPDLYPSQNIRTGVPKDGNLYPPASGAAPSVTYGLGAVDTGVGRRYWQSPTVSFASAPTPVGTWDTASLRVMYSFL